MGTEPRVRAVQAFATAASRVTTASEALVVFVEAARAAERAVFGGIPPRRRDRGIGDTWSAKDVLAHISAWRDRQARRLTAGGGTRGPSGDRMAIRLNDVTLEAVNAKSHAQRAAWTWEQVEADADASAERLIAALRATDLGLLRDGALLVGSILGSGPLHDLEHLSAVPGSRRMAPSRALVQVGRRIAESGALGENDAARLLYNLACREALDGRLVSARSLLDRALGMRPALSSMAAADQDLVRLRSGLEA
jgi:hypothetical protein